jgi:hypothetical protein
VLKRSLIVLVLAAVGLVIGTAVVSASTHYADLCVPAAAAGGSLAAGTPLASTGSAVNVGLWALIGAAVLAVGIALTLMGRAGRSVGSSAAGQIVG